MWVLWLYICQSARRDRHELYIVGTVAAADEILILGRNAAGDWLKERVGDTEAWLFASLVTTNTDIAALPVVE